MAKLRKVSNVAFMWSLLTVTVIGTVLLAQAQSVTLEGRTYAGDNVPNLLFYSRCAFDKAVLVVKACYGDTHLAVDYGEPVAVREGTTLTAFKQIDVTKGGLDWELTVTNMGSTSLKSGGVFEDGLTSGPHKKEGKTLFEGEWSPWENWVVVSVRTVGHVEFIHYEFRASSGELQPGDHVLSLSQIDEPNPFLFPPALTVRIGGLYGASVTAKMWKWLKQ
jgi:hypothetical protein